MSARVELSMKERSAQSSGKDPDLQRSLTNLVSILKGSMYADVGGIILKDKLTGDIKLISIGFTEKEKKQLTLISKTRLESIGRLFSSWWKGAAICYSLQLRTGKSIIFAGRRSNVSFSLQERDFIKDLAEYAFIATDRYLANRQAETLALAEERERVAVELHDGLAQSIYSFALQIKACRHLLHKDLQAADDKLKILENLAGEQIEQIRSYMRNLKAHREITDDFNNMIKRLSSHVCAINNLDYSFESSGYQTELSHDITCNLYYVVSEALTNIIRHSSAGAVKTNIVYDEAELELRIEDDGCGFDVSRQLKHGKPYGMGLENIENRISLLGGNLNIQSRPGAGTRIIALVPYERFVEETV